MLSLHLSFLFLFLWMQHTCRYTDKLKRITALLQDLQTNEMGRTANKEKSTLWKKTQSFFSSEVDESQSIKSKATKMKTAIFRLCYFMYEMILNFPYLSLVPSFGFLSFMTKVLHKSSSHLSFLMNSIKTLLLIFTHGVMKTVSIIFNGLAQLCQFWLSLLSMLKLSERLLLLLENQFVVIFSFLLNFTFLVSSIMYTYLIKYD